MHLSTVILHDEFLINGFEQMKAYLVTKWIWGKKEENTNASMVPCSEMGSKGGEGLVEG